MKIKLEAVLDLAGHILGLLAIALLAVKVTEQLEQAKLDRVLLDDLVDTDIRTRLVRLEVGAGITPVHAAGPAAAVPVHEEPELAPEDPQDAVPEPEPVLPKRTGKTARPSLRAVHNTKENTGE